MSLVENGLEAYDFENVEFEKQSVEFCKDPIVVVKVPNLGTIFMPHYYNIDEFKEKWFRRLKRMKESLKSGVCPVFVMSLSNLRRYKYLISQRYYDGGFLSEIGKHQNVYLYTTSSL